MPTARPVFARFPALEAGLAPLSLCTLPTPVQLLPSIAPHAWVKRDDETHPEYAGNKLRKLEYVAAEMRRRGAERAITFGAVGTNAGVAAAMVCRDLGIACEVLTFDQPASKTVTNNGVLMRHYGARVRHIGSLAGTAIAWQLHPRRLDRRAYFLFAGCSNRVATFAYVDAAFELKAQVDAGACPAPAEIVVAAGSGATLAGLTLGCALAGLPTRVVGVRVAPAKVGPFHACTTKTVARMMRTCRATIARATGERSLPLPAVTLEDAWFGDGYGVPTQAGADAIAVLGAAGVTLEQTYTAKAAAAFLARVRASPAPCLFWNTFSARPAPPGASGPSTSGPPGVPSPLHGP